MRTAASLSSLLLLLACGSRKEDSIPEGNPSLPEGDECTTDEQCDAGRICELSACVAGDRDNSPEEATGAFYEEGNEGLLNPAEDVDWWSITGSSGTFVRITTSKPESSTVDTVVSLYDAAGRRLAWEDGYAGGTISSLDTLLYAYFPEDGTYYVKVEDVATFYDDPDLVPYGSDTSVYELIISDYGLGGDEPDALYEAGIDYEVSGAKLVYPIPVAFSDETDSDYAAFTLPFDDCPIYLFTMQHDDGSDASLDLKLYNADGELVFSKEDPARDVEAQLIAAQGRQYVLEVSDSSGRSGSSHWGWVFLLLGEEGDGNEREVEPNNDILQAQSLEPSDREPDSGTWFSFYGQGTVEDLLDTDVYAFKMEEELYVSVALGAQGYGGLLVTRLEILDANGSVLETVDSSPGLDLDAENLGPYSSGDYFLRVSAVPDSLSTCGEGCFYRFGIHTASFLFN